QQWIDNGFSTDQLLEDFDQLLKDVIKDEMNEMGDFSPFYQQLDEMEKALSNLVTKQDQSLRGAVGSSINSMKKALSNTEGKYKKSIKRKNEQKLNQLLKIQKQVIQNNGLVERKESFISAYLTFENLPKLLLEHASPGLGVLTLLLYKK
ncbi:MAG: bacillithiol biosynthesis BshC, partial [Bacteroidota bacterium]|nr:bacillithiol biosynthesis BshC [Bacteroidota bacterium]